MPDASAALRVRRQSAAKWIAAILAVAVHVAFVLFLVFSVNWQNRKPEPVTAELYVPPAAPKVEPAKPPEPAASRAAQAGAAQTGAAQAAGRAARSRRRVPNSRSPTSRLRKSRSA